MCRIYGIPETAYKYNAQKNFIQFSNGSYVNFIEVSYKPSDPMYEDVGSTEYTIGWFEEVGEIHYKAVNTLQTRVGRHMNSEYNLHPTTFMTCNPKNNWAKQEFYNKHKTGELYELNKDPERNYIRKFMTCLVVENPFIEQQNINNLKKQASTDKGQYERCLLYTSDAADE